MIILFGVLIVFTILRIFIFNKSIQISTKNIVTVSYTNTEQYGVIIQNLLFALLLIYVFITSNSYIGWTLFISLPFSILVLYPLYQSIRDRKKKIVLTIDSETKTIFAHSDMYNVLEVDLIKVTYIVSNANDNSEYVISLLLKNGTNVYVISLEENKEVRLLLDCIESSLKVKVQCFQDRGLLGIKEMSRSDL